MSVWLQNLGNMIHERDFGCMESGVTVNGGPSLGHIIRILSSVGVRSEACRSRPEPRSKELSFCSNLASISERVVSYHFNTFLSAFVLRGSTNTFSEYLIRPEDSTDRGARPQLFITGETYLRSSPLSQKVYNLNSPCQTDIPPREY